MKIMLRRVRYIPKVLDPGVLYVADEFGAAAHLCPCGCGAKVRTPLSPTDWSLELADKGPSLRPSIGNWQQACKSHYWIHEGEIEWARPWTDAEVETGWQLQEKRQRSYYDHHKQKNLSGRLRDWVVKFFKKFTR